MSLHPQGVPCLCPVGISRVSLSFIHLGRTDLLSLCSGFHVLAERALWLLVCMGINYELGLYKAVLGTPASLAMWSVSHCPAGCLNSHCRSRHWKDLCARGDVSPTPCMKFLPSSPYDERPEHRVSVVLAAENLSYEKDSIDFLCQRKQVRVQWSGLLGMDVHLESLMLLLSPETVKCPKSCSWKAEHKSEVVIYFF